MNPVDQMPESALERVEQAPSGALRPRVRNASRSCASDSPMPGEGMESPNGPASQRTRDGVFVAVDDAVGENKLVYSLTARVLASRAAHKLFGSCVHRPLQPRSGRL